MINLPYLLFTIPPEDWYRNFPASRSFIMRITSKELYKAMDIIRPPVNIRFISDFIDLSPNWYCVYRIQKLEILACSMSEENKNKLVRLLEQCPALVKLKIVGNYNFGPTATDRLIQVLPLCPALNHLNLSGNTIEDTGAKSLARILGLFSSLNHLDLSWNQIGSKGVDSLAGVLRQCTALTHLDLNNNNIRPNDTNINNLLQQCQSLKHLDISGNRFGTNDINNLVQFANWLTPESLSDNLTLQTLQQCLSLKHLDLSGNRIATGFARQLQFLKYRIIY